MCPEGPEASVRTRNRIKVEKKKEKETRFDFLTLFTRFTIVIIITSNKKKN